MYETVLKRLSDGQELLRLAKAQREHYYKQCEEAANKLNESSTLDTMHYNFDFAQQIDYPFHP